MEKKMAELALGLIDVRPLEKMMLRLVSFDGEQPKPPDISE